MNFEKEKLPRKTGSIEKGNREEESGVAKGAYFLELRKAYYQLAFDK